MEERIKQVKKFLKLFNITYKISSDKSGINKQSGLPFECVLFEVFYNKNLEYMSYYCFELLRNGEVRWVEGNTIKGVNEGILRYFGDDTAIQFYFSRLSKEFVKNKI